MTELLSTEDVEELCSKVSTAQADMVKAISKWESAKATCRKAGIELKTEPKDMSYIFYVCGYKYAPVLHLKETPD